MPEKVVYTGHFVKDRDALLEQLPPAISGEGSQIHAHHVTREFKPSDGIEGIEPGKERALRIVGHVAAEGVHVAIVEAPDGENISLNEHPHLTIATAAGISPVKSNEVVERAKQDGTVVLIDPPIEVTTVEGCFDGKQVHIK